MDRLKEKILKEGRYLGNGILKVDSFMNHQIDPILMKEIGEEFARRFALHNIEATRILTAEASGIAPSLSLAMALQIPVVFARKNKPVTMADKSFTERAESHTQGKMVDLTVSSAYLKPQDKIIIVDDFLASARTLKALVKIVAQAQAQLVAVGAVIEKSFEGGRSALSDLNVPIESLATIASFDDDKVNFA